MLRNSRGLLCPFCEIKTIIVSRGIERLHYPLSVWRASISSQALAKERRPKRMQLSDTVARTPPHPMSKAPRSRDDNAPRPPVMRNGPFAGMNRTSVPASVEAERRRIEIRRAKLKEKEEKMKARNQRPWRTQKRAERQPGVMKALHMQQSLSRVSYDQRNAIKNSIAEQKRFSDLPLLSEVQDSIASDALKGLEEISMTPIQRLAIPALLGLRDRRSRRAQAPDDGSLKSFLLAAETGSGKTLAYAIPTMDALKRVEGAEQQRNSQKLAAKETVRQRKGNIYELEPPPLSNLSSPDAGRPRAIVLVPSSELVDQVGGEFKKLSHNVKLRVAFISAAYSAAIIRNRVFSNSGIDVLISTPHLLHSLAESEPNILSRVSHLIVDEADSLLDRSFSPLTTAIIERASPSLKQLMFCSATIPRSLDKHLSENYPNMLRLTTPNLHAIPRRIAFSVQDIDKDPYKGNRKLACADYIWKIGLDVEAYSSSLTTRVIVFVNERETAEEVASFLQTKGVDAVALSRDVTDQDRADILAPFVTAAPTAAEEALERENELFKNDSRSSRTLANTKVLVTTDLASRGIDTVAIKHVVLYDVPHTSIDFIHRLGRIGRMGRRGRGVVLVGKGDRRDVVSEIKEAVFRGSALI